MIIYQDLGLDVQFHEYSNKILPGVISVLNQDPLVFIRALSEVSNNLAITNRVLISADKDRRRRHTEFQIQQKKYPEMYVGNPHEIERDFYNRMPANIRNLDLHFENPRSKIPGGLYLTRNRRFVWVSDHDRQFFKRVPDAK